MFLYLIFELFVEEIGLSLFPLECSYFLSGSFQLHRQGKIFIFYFLLFMVVFITF